MQPGFFVWPHLSSVVLASEKAYILRRRSPVKYGGWRQKFSVRTREDEAKIKESRGFTTVSGHVEPFLIGTRERQTDRGREVWLHVRGILALN